MSLVIENMKWSNLFSYGANNYIDFTENPLTQLVGLNGHGKSSIPIILELALFNKNSKGIKSGDILNRYVDDKFYSIEVNFTQHTDKYNLQVRRASTQTIKLTKNGTDISAHTATNTLALVESILGFDHKTFCQLFYQSSVTSMEFLTSTDTNRKKFLVDFLDLGKYTKAFELVNVKAKEMQQELVRKEASIKTMEAWLTKNSTVDLTKRGLLEIPELNTKHKRQEVARIREDINRIVETNKAIIANNKYKSLMDAIDISSISSDMKLQDTTQLSIDKAFHENEYRSAEAFINHVHSLKSECPTCKHPIDNSKQLELVGEKQNIRATSKDAINSISKKLSEIIENNKIVTQNETKKAQWEQYHSLYNGSMKSEILDKNDLEATLLSLEKEIVNDEKQLADLQVANQVFIEHNAKVDVIRGQLDETKKDLDIAKDDLSNIQALVSKYAILVKAFSTNGLIAFKIESMIKDLEVEVNTYLAELSYGRFQVSFVIAGEKLDVVISDNGTNVTMSALSSGEKARVNTATLLAIRKVMQNISKVKVNILVLDETIDNLDTDGKERLVDVLLGEEHLNTIVISHGYNHPLLEKVLVTKHNNISKIE